MDAVKEMQVLLSPSTCGTATSPDIMLNAVTKNGTNEFTVGPSSRTAIQSSEPTSRSFGIRSSRSRS